MEGVSLNGPVVALGLLVMQMLKMWDQKDKLKNWYGAMSLVVGLVCGLAYSMLYDGKDFGKAAIDGVMNAGAMQLAWTAKEALFKPVGLTLPGDTKEG